MLEADLDSKHESTKQIKFSSAYPFPQCQHILIGRYLLCEIGKHIASHFLVHVVILEINCAFKLT